MEARVRLIVEELGEGVWQARVVGRGDLRAQGASAGAAVESLRPAVLRALGDGRSTFLDQCRCPRDLRLLPLTLDVKPRGEQDSLPVRVGLLVGTHRLSAGPRRLVTAPNVAQLQLLLPPDEPVEKRATARLQRLARQWTLADVVEIDQPGAMGLEVMDLREEWAALNAPSVQPQEEDVLAECGVDLIARARRDRLGRADRRESLVERLAHTLAQDGARSAMLVGPAEAGKTALVHELARRLVEGRVPARLEGRALWQVTGADVIAEMRFIGEWEGRARRLVAQAQQRQAMLFMGDPAQIIGAGRTSQTDHNLGRYLRPAIESGDITVICECTPEVYGACAQREPGFTYAFHRIDVPETSAADTLAIIHAAAHRLAAAHGVSVEPEAVNTLIDLTARFLPYRSFPGKAIRSLEAMVRDDLAGAAAGDGRRHFGGAEAVASFTRATGLPAALLSDSYPLRPEDVRQYFEDGVLGQPDAVDAVVNLVHRIKAGLTDPAKPLASLYFVGPTGVGKTELAKLLAEFIFGSRDRLIRFDMGEFATGDALARLIGTAWPADEQAGRGELTRLVRQQPFCVLLLDEIEKAHPAVFNVLLGVLGEGRLTDARGATTDFRNAIIVMTSNLGAGQGEMQSIGFSHASPAAQSVERLRQHFEGQAKQFFRPEFLNRIDRLVAFRPLTLDDMRRITRRELGKLLLRQGILRRQLQVEIDEAVIERLAQVGFDPAYGARPLQRQVERLVIDPLARLLVEHGAEAQGRSLRLSLVHERIQVSLLATQAPDEDMGARRAASRRERRLEADVADLLRLAHGLRERGAALAAGPLAQRLRQEAAALLERTGQPTFWDDPRAAREALGRFYEVDQVLKGLDGLVERAGHLEEQCRQLPLGRPTQDVAEVARALATLRTGLDYVEVDLGGVASGVGREPALLRVTPVGHGAEGWAARLLDMYAAWARRKGYEHQWLDVERPALLPVSRTGRERPEAAGLLVNDGQAYHLLRGEAGLHRLDDDAGDERGRTLARVSVWPVPPSAMCDPKGLAVTLRDLVRAGLPDGAGDDAVARIYSEGRHRAVRDPRTRVRDTDLVGVLQRGQIDHFLIANLRHASGGE